MENNKKHIHDKSLKAFAWRDQIFQQDIITQEGIFSDPIAQNYFFLFYSKPLTGQRTSYFFDRVSAR